MANNTYLKTAKYLWKKGKLWLIFTLICTIILSFIPVIGIYITKELINVVSELVTDTNGDYRYALILLSIQLLLGTISSIVENTKNYHTC
ncbi:hypothetical protein [Bacillus sp. 123MFChir2]|uniref:hypothetical protein n=1 Tax=Bacillus sp. 123MFChir2 TaxID=1169144 RepID=UPI00037112F1|nr:hypothetical protein [Bacillus sp. 123MFChir2]